MEMELMRLLDMQLVERALLIIFLGFAGPVILTIIPLKVFDPLRRAYYPLCRRGKLHPASDSAGRDLRRFTVPQSFFMHFYAVGLLVNTILLFISFGFACKISDGSRNQFSSVLAQLTGAVAHHTLFAGSPGLDLAKFGQQAWRLVFLLLLFEIHTMRRLYECLFVSKFDPSARMNVFGYFMALGYYVFVPLALFAQAFSHEGFANAFTVFLTQKLKQGEEEIELVHGIPDAKHLISYMGSVGWRPYIGAALYFYGAYHQNVCHEILAALRANDTRGSVKKYYIPMGDWFELVSCPHYFAEVIIYVGLLVASGGTSPTMYLVLGLVVSNLYMIAKPTHEWYIAKFDDYPKSRRAMIPYLC